MATRDETTIYVLEQLRLAGDVSARKMFGEVGIYCDRKFAALICDDELYIKPTADGRAFAPTVKDGTPYPNAKPHLHITGDLLEDAEWVSTLLRITTAALPAATPKKGRKK